MARVVATPKDRNVRIRLHADLRGMAVLVPKGVNAYLWIGPRDEETDRATVYTFSGAVALRRLARAILKELPAPRARGRR
jgi:hypothetical protein